MKNLSPQKQVSSFGMFTVRDSFEDLPIFTADDDLYSRWVFQYVLPDATEFNLGPELQLELSDFRVAVIEDWLYAYPYEHHDIVLRYDFDYRWYVSPSKSFTPTKFLKRKIYLSKLKYQSGLDLETVRERREIIQRSIAAKKAEIVRKEEPKRVRLDRIKAKRDKRLGIPPIELQAGISIRTGLALGVGGIMAARAGIRGVKHISKKVGDGFNQIGRLANLFKSQADRMTSSLGGVVGGVTGNLSQLTEVFVQFKEMLEELVKKMKKLLANLWVIPIALVLFQFLRTRTNPAFAGLILSFLPSFFGLLWPHISAFFPKGRVENQAGVNTLAALLSTCFTFSVFKGNVTPAKVSEFVRRIGSVKRQSEGWESLITWMMGSIEVLVNFIRKKVGKESIELFDSGDRIVKSWATRVETVLKDDATGQEMNPVKLDSIVKLLQEGYGFKELYRMTEVGRMVDVLVARLGAVIIPHMGSIAARNNFRFEPVATFLYGQAGVGKTILAVPLVTAILLSSGLVPTPCTADAVMAQMWQKGTSEYWQGYNGQTAMIMDDAFQNRAVAGDKDNDYFNLIKMVGSFSMPLNFADVASKGKIFFNSKIIFASTNLASLLSEAQMVIHEPAAVARRITFGLELFVSPEFTNSEGHLDYRKFLVEREACAKRSAANPDSDPLDFFPWYIWQVSEHDFLKGSTVSTRVDLRSQINTIVDVIKIRLASHTSSSEFLTDFVGAYSKSGSVASGVTPVTLQAGFSKADYEDFLKAKETSPDYVLRDIGGEVGNDRVFTQEEIVPGMLLNAIILDRANRQDDGHCIENFLVKFLPIISILASFFLVTIIIKAFVAMLISIGKSIFCRGPKISHQSNIPASKRVGPSKTVVRLQSDVPYTPGEHAFMNSYKMVSDTLGKVFGQVTFISGTLAYQPQHFTALVKSCVGDGSLVLSDFLEFKSALSSSVVISFTVEKYLSFARVSDPDSDVEFVRFESVRAHSDITRIFVTEADLKYVGNRPGNLHLLEVDPAAKFLEKNKYIKFCFPYIAISENLTGLPDGRRMKRFAAYNAGTKGGDCGALLTLTDPKLCNNRVLVGFHVANFTGTSKGISSIVTQEMVKNAQVKLKTEVDSFLLDLANRKVQLQSSDILPPSHGGSFLPIGILEKPVTICPVSRYFKTALHGSLGPYEYYPAPLSAVMRDGVRVFPMEQAVVNYSTPLLHHTFKFLDDAVHIATKPFFEATMHVKRQLYSFEDAIKGIPQEKFRSIPRNTAAGFPYVYDVKGGKREFFGSEGDYDLSGPQAIDLEERVNVVLASAKKGERLSHIFIDFLKDELRSKKKIEAVATRLISSAPLDYVVAFRMMFGAFTSAMMRHNVTTGLAPGICVYADWPRMAAHVTRMGPSVFDGDFTAFDSSEQPVVHMAILDFVNRWYNDSEENQLARRILWLELIHSRHVGGVGNDQRYVYQWNKSLPSGHPFTTVVNSLYSLVTLVGCYMHITGDKKYFWEKVSPLVYGDDNVVNVADSIKDVYNQVTVSAAMMECFGLKYTSGAKDGVLAPFTTIDNITFLKRRFYCDSRGWLCPLELDSFLYTHYWCKNKSLVEPIMLDSLENALEELSLHPPVTWDEYAPKIADIIADHYNATTRCVFSRDSYLSSVLERTEEWY
jgi:hypothetical protein